MTPFNLCDRFVRWWQRRCTHEPHMVQSNYGMTTSLTKVDWCRRCGAVRGRWEEALGGPRCGPWRLPAPLIYYPYKDSPNDSTPVNTGD